MNVLRLVEGEQCLSTLVVVVVDFFDFDDLVVVVAVLALVSFVVLLALGNFLRGRRSWQDRCSFHKFCIDLLVAVVVVAELLIVVV